MNTDFVTTTFAFSETAPSWQQAVHELTASQLNALIAGAIPAIHLKNFATAKECRRFCTALQEQDIKQQAAHTSPMNLVGSNFANFKGTQKSEYFATVETSYADIAKLTRVSLDPLQRMLDRLNAIWPDAVDIAQEPGYGRYFAGGVKSRVNGSQLHFDYVPLLRPDFQIGQIIDQLAWNLYLDMPGTTGQTRLYNAPIAAQRATHTASHWDNKLSADQVAMKQHYTFHGQVGEVVLFNTRYPHTIVVDEPKISKSGELRTQIGSFIGRLSNNKLILWS